MRRFEQRAHAEASAAREAEMSELHAANARIAKLAFAQATATSEEAAAALEELIEPSRGRAHRLREQLQRVLDRDLARRETASRRELTRRAWDAMASASGVGVGSERGGGRSAPGGGGGAGAAVLTRQVARLKAEIEELTNELVLSKLNAAELAISASTVSHEKRQLEKQLVVEATEVHELDALEHTRSGANGNGTRAMRPRAASFHDETPSIQAVAAARLNHLRGT
jgi:hypothetical protein